ncbi:hypothetical protein H8E07_14660 [bacterium]|nr:hypothetical protein [bacterium]
MKKFVNTTAMTAAFVTLCFSLLRDFGVYATFKRAAIAYIAFSVVGTILGLIFRAGIQDEWAQDEKRRRMQIHQRLEEERLDQEATRQAERDRRKEERKKQLIGEDSNSV